MDQRLKYGSWVTKGTAGGRGGAFASCAYPCGEPKLSASVIEQSSAEPYLVPSIFLGCFNIHAQAEEVRNRYIYLVASRRDSMSFPQSGSVESKPICSHCDLLLESINQFRGIEFTSILFARNA